MVVLLLNRKMFVVFVEYGDDSYGEGEVDADYIESAFWSSRAGWFRSVLVKELG